jgi:response regulator of citrate/malate metabolism
VNSKQQLFSENEGILPIDVPSVMIVESDPCIAETLQEVVKKELQLDLLFASTAKGALQITQVLRPLMFVINEHLIDGDGVSLVEQLTRRRVGMQQLPIILLSTNRRSCQQQTRNPYLFLMDLPFELEDLISTITHLVALSGQPLYAVQKPA